MASEAESYPVWVFRDLAARGGAWTAWRSGGEAPGPTGGLRFGTVEEAVAWAAERSPCVLVNVDRDRKRPNGWWSAGPQQPDDGGPYPAWPPARYGVRIALHGLPDEVVGVVPAAMARAPALAGAELSLRPAGPGTLSVSFTVRVPSYSQAEQAGMDAFFPALDHAWAESGADDAPLFFSYAVTPQS